MRRAFKYKAQISKETEQAAINWLRLCQRLYNAALEQRIDAYQRCGISRTQYDQAKELKVLKQEFPEYKKVGSQVLKNVLERLDLAYKAFFRRAKSGGGKQAGFPRFQGYRYYNSFTFPNSSGWRVDGRFLHIAHVGRFKLYPNRPIVINEVVNLVPRATIDGMDVSVATITVKRESTGKWFVVFSCNNVPDHRLPVAEPARTVGLDAGITHFSTDSNGRKVNNPKLYEAAERLRILQRKLSRAQKGSKRREQVRLQVARLHEKIMNQRNDFACKLAHEYATNYDYIAVEKLDITGMTVKQNGRHAQLPKRIHDAAWRNFQFRLESQCEDHGKVFGQPPAANTSKTCSRCGSIQDMPLEVRTYQCHACGFQIDRDLNAALNIRNRAFP